MPLLAIKNLSQKINKKAILHNISLEMDGGQIIALLGPNGAGKTTLLKTIIGFHPTPNAEQNNTHNALFLQEELINQWPIHKKVHHGLTYLAQQTSLFQYMTVKENLQLIYEYHPYWHKKETADFFLERDTLLAQTDLTSTLKQQAKYLSGGQKRKVEIVRAMLMHPKIILLDEPFAGVDPKSIYEIKKIFVDMAKNGIGILISDHHVDQLLSIAHKIYVILQGKVVTSGTIKDILENNHLKENYLGDQFYQEVAERFLR